jgi:putative toxin-antitoxin system antitoxin component (TIGR02293 family)
MVRRRSAEPLEGMPKCNYIYRHMVRRAHPMDIRTQEWMLDISHKSRDELLSAVRKGLPAQTILRIIQLGFDSQLVLRAIGKRTTIERKIKEHKLLNQQESERLERVCRIVAQANEVFSGQVKAREWLERPTDSLCGARVPPLSLLDTEIGGRMVEERLNQIAHGMYL